MTDFAHAGTVISGTHRTQDLIPAFVGKLTELDAERAERITAQYPVTMADLEGDNFDAANALLDDLTDALNELAPEGMYFGTIEGDGADFGFWVVDGFRQCDKCGRIEEAHLAPDWPNGICPQCERPHRTLPTLMGRWSNYA